MSDAERQATLYAFTCWTGITMNGRHVSLEDFYMKPEELDKARAEEAWRLHNRQEGVTPCVVTKAARLAREGWTPAPEVDHILECLRDAGAEFAVDVFKHSLASRGLKIVSEDAEEKQSKVLHDALIASQDEFIPPAMSRDYRAGVEAAIEWVAQHTMVSYYRRMDMRRDLLGGAGDVI